MHKHYRITRYSKFMPVGPLTHRAALKYRQSWSTIKIFSQIEYWTNQLTMHIYNEEIKKKTAKLKQLVLLTTNNSSA